MHFQLGVFSIGCFLWNKFILWNIAKDVEKIYNVLIKNSNKNLQNVRDFFFWFNHMKTHISCTASIKITYDI
jgi:uncharacterized protein YktB (UPF0637 family)